MILFRRYVTGSEVVCTGIEGAHRYWSWTVKLSLSNAEVTHVNQEHSTDVYRPNNEYSNDREVVNQVFLIIFLRYFLSFLLNT